MATGLGSINTLTPYRSEGFPRRKLSAGPTGACGINERNLCEESIGSVTVNVVLHRLLTLSQSFLK